MDSLEIVQCFRSNTPAGQCPWTLSTDSMDFFHWFHGLSTDGKSGAVFHPCFRDLGQFAPYKDRVKIFQNLRILILAPSYDLPELHAYVNCTIAAKQDSLAE